MTATSIDTTARFDGDGNPVPAAEQAPEIQAGATEQGPGTGKPESELRAAARRHGLTLKELAVKMGVSYGYLSSVSAGRRPWSPMLREMVAAVLGEVPGEGVVYRQGGLVKGGSTFIRERARELGMSLHQLSERSGVSYGYLCQTSRGQRNMGVNVQRQVEEALEAPVQIASAQRPCVDQRALWDRMNAHGFSQNETARLAGISSALLSNIMNGKRTPSGTVLKKLHRVLFQPTQAELVVPAEVKVMAWKKDDRKGVVVRGAGGPGAGSNPGGGTVRIGGRVPWGAEVEYAYRAGYDSRGRVSVTHVVDERGYAVMLTKPEPDGAGSGEDRTTPLSTELGATPTACSFTGYETSGRRSCWSWKRPQPPPCSIGRSAWSRSGRRSRSARAARPVTRGGRPSLLRR